MIENKEADAARATSTWARLIHKVCEVDPLESPRCKGLMRVIALIEDPDAIRKIIEHLRRWAPRQAPQRDPRLAGICAAATTTICHNASRNHAGGTHSVPDIGRTTPMEDVVIRYYREGDEIEINRLFNEIFAETRSLEEWHWKFKQNPTNVMMIAVAESAGRIVGQYAEIWKFFQYVNKVVLVTMPVDNFVDPQFRGGMKGVQKAMFEYPDRRSKGPFGFGFPNKAHYIIGKRMLEYLDVGKMPVLFRRLNWRLAARRRVPRMPFFLLKVIQLVSNIGFRIFVKVSKRHPGSDLHTRTVSSFDERFDALWHRVKNKHKVVCVRDQRFLNWRYSKPGADYRIVIAEKGDELVGYAVIGVKHDAAAIVGYIADLITDDSPGVDVALLRCSILDLLSRKADYALCWMLPDKDVFQSLCDFGFAQHEEAFPSVNIVFQIFPPQAVSEKVLNDPRSWYLTMADSDVF